MGLLYGENCMILTSTIFDWSTRVTDRQTDGRNCDSICALTACAVARKNLWFHRQRCITGHFCQSSPLHRLQSQPFWSANVSAGVFPMGVFTAFVASQRSSAVISSLPAAMSFFAVKLKSAFLLPTVLSKLTRPCNVRWNGSTNHTLCCWNEWTLLIVVRLFSVCWWKT